MIVIKLTDIDKAWVQDIFKACQKDLMSDFEKAWAEGVFYGVQYKGFIRFKFGKENYICELAISPQYRNRGIAKELLKYAIPPCLVATHVHNIAANKLYQSSGFLHQGEVIDSAGNMLNLYLKR